MVADLKERSELVSGRAAEDAKIGEALDSIEDKIAGVKGRAHTHRVKIVEVIAEPINCEKILAFTLYNFHNVYVIVNVLRLSSCWVQP
jgi:hypothetical protein